MGIDLIKCPKPDFFRVSKLMGHQDLNMTKAYANFSPSRIEADFPTLAKKYVNE